MPTTVHQDNVSQSRRKAQTQSEGMMLNGAEATDTRVKKTHVLQLERRIRHEAYSFAKSSMQIHEPHGIQSIE